MAEFSLERLERSRRARRGKYYLNETVITMSHGSGGKASQALIEGVFVEAFDNDLLMPLNDQAVFSLEGSRLALSTDSYVVDPLFFPGGDIGRLAVNGTVNDLAMAGAVPLYLTLGVILEEGYPIAELRRVVASIAQAASQAGVAIVTGDTKVVPRGKADKLYLNTAGVGIIQHQQQISPQQAQPGDRILINGPIGNHGIAVLGARGDLELEMDVSSDTAALNSLVQDLLATGARIHCLKDPTRGGVATSLNEVAQASNVGVEIQESSLPVDAGVYGACEILGLDPLYIANEGKLLAIVPPSSAELVLAGMRSHPLGREARDIGQVLAEPEGMVYLRTSMGGTRVVDMLVGDPLPRIC